jgi:predicted RNA-binding protein
MTYWFASSNRDNWEIIKKKNIWGIPIRNKAIIERVKPGDNILIYVSQKKENDEILPSAITGAFEIISKGHKDTIPIFITPEKMGNEVFPYRVRLKPIKIFKEPLEFKQLIPKLKFIKNKTMWTGHIRVAMREIPEEDYKFILKSAKD